MVSEQTPTRACTKCGEAKPRTTEFFHPDKGYAHGLNSRCRQCLKKYRAGWQRRYRASPEGKQAHREATRKWEKSEAGSEKNRAAKRSWNKRNREKILRRARELRGQISEDVRVRRRATARAYRRKLCAESPSFRLRVALSARIAVALRTRGTSKRSRNWEQLVGYTLPELKAHIERQFVGRMSWDNYGDWHVDHIVPVAAFRWKSTDDPEFRACWALSNLRPLWAPLNREKKNKRLHLL